MRKTLFVLAIEILIVLFLGTILILTAAHAATYNVSVTLAQTSSQVVVGGALNTLYWSMYEDERLSIYENNRDVILIQNK